jgi:hypothetical protein
MSLSRRRAIAHGVLPIALLWLSSLPALATVTCAVVQRGRLTCTYYCQNGYTCDLANKKCLPGPEIMSKVQKLLDEAARIRNNLNRDQIARRSAAENRAFGYVPGETYYIWDGNPKEIPTPRYRPRFTAMPASAASRATGGTRTPGPAGARSTAVRSQIEALLTAALQFPSGDPNRANIIKTVRKVVRDNNIPIDVDEFLGCAAPVRQAGPALKPYQLRWRVPDIIPEIEKRGLCAGAKDDEAREACHKEQFGRVVMSVEPEIKALCKLQENDPQENDIDALAECAERKFKNAWALRDGALPPAAQSGAQRASTCPSPLPPDKHDDLRKRLREALAKAGAPEDVDEPSPEATAPSAPPAQAENDAPVAPQPDIDDPFCAYIARKAVRGELTPGGGAQIPAYCKTAMDAAKTCEEQKCSMADIIAEQEKKQKTSQLPWGSADQEAIKALQR